MQKKDISAKDILGNPKYKAICYGGYRQNTRDIQPTIAELKEDMKILAALDFKILRTYNVQLPHAKNVVEAIHQLKSEDPTFEMYVMLGAWIDCKNAWTGHQPDHYVESEQNEGEIARAVAIANQYPDIVKIVAVGNEAMIRWATSYYVQPGVILHWVNHLQNLKKEGKLSKDVWITSSDNFASWGGASEYHTHDLVELIKAVDYISLHTYPMHDTHYNPIFWKLDIKDSLRSKEWKINKLMTNSVNYAKDQYQSVKQYVAGLGIDKPIHIGETGWASGSVGLYGDNGSKACDEYKQALYYKMIRDWTQKENISCFYFEAFDENWKDSSNPKGSENHFGLFTVDGKAKYVLWDEVDKKTFKGLGRDGKVINKTYSGSFQAMSKEVRTPNFFRH